MGDDVALRLVTLVILLAGITASGMLRRRADRLGGAVPRAADGRAMQIALATSALIFYGSVLVWLIYPPALAWAAIALPAGARWLGAALVAAGMALGVWAIAHLGRNVTPTHVAREDASLVTSGPYRYVRHPLYASGLLLLPGCVLATSNVLVLTAGVAGLVAILIRVRREEAELVRRFGAAYTSYMTRTGRIVPWVGRSSSRDR